MPTDLVDLDALDPLPVPVKIAGETFKVPGAAPLAWLFKFRQLEDSVSEDTDEGDYLEAIRDSIADLIAIEQPTRRNAAILALDKKSPRAVLMAVRTIYAGQAEPEQEADPTQRPTSRTTRNGSSRSSAAKRKAARR